MTRARGVGRTGGGALALVAPAPAARALGARALGYVALDPLRAALDALDWAPLRLAAGRAARPLSPRLPHALALHLALAAREAGGAVVPDRTRLAAMLGASAAQLGGALDALVRAGVVVVSAGHGEAVALAAAVLGPAPRCAALDWGALAAATAGSPSAWVAAHALAERLERYQWTPVPRAELEYTLGAGASGARAALDRLVAAGAVERREQRGGVSGYRFTEWAWGGGGVPVTSAVATAGPPVAVASDVVSSGGAAVRAAAEPASGVRLVVGGVEVEVPAGLRARVEIGADGRPTLTLLPGG